MGGKVMKWRIFVLSLVLAVPRLTPAATQNRFIVRSTLGVQALTQLCALPILGCTVVGGLDGSLNQLFLLTTPSTVDPTIFLTTLRATAGIVDAELDQLLSIVGGLNKVTTVPSGLSNTTLVNYYGASVWQGYVNQPAATIVQVSQAQNTFSVTGAGIVADIDTGVDPNHPALQGVLLPGYDFTRNQQGASEINDLTPTDFPAFPPSACSGSTCPQPAIVNQSSAAILDQSSAAILDQNTKYAAFGHGTMVMGVIHLVAPQAKLLPLKAFNSDGTGYLSDILRAIYYAVQNNAKIVNTSFEFKVSSPDPELQTAINYANQLGVVCSASVGNDAQLNPTVYPAGFTTAVMGIASTSDLDTRSSFSNYGNAIVFVAAPGEAIITTYPFATYAAGWGTSFSAPFVSGGASLLLNKQPSITHALAASAIANADVVGPDLGHGRLNLVLALGSLTPPATASDFVISAAPPNASITAGQSASYTASITPVGGFKGIVMLSCGGAPAASTCSISPSQVTLDGTDPAIASVTITTAARSFLPPLGPRRFDPLLLVKLLARFFAYLLVCVVCALLWRLARIPRKRLLLTAAVALPIALMFTSCGGSSSSTTSLTTTNPPPTQPSGTPQGTFTITVTGTSANLSHTTNVMLKVN
jgi:subtilisin family serine protease